MNVNTRLSVNIRVDIALIMGRTDFIMHVCLCLQCCSTHKACFILTTKRYGDNILIAELHIDTLHYPLASA